MRPRRSEYGWECWIIECICFARRYLEVLGMSPGASNHGQLMIDYSESWLILTLFKWKGLGQISSDATASPQLRMANCRIRLPPVLPLRGARRLDHRLPRAGDRVRACCCSTVFHRVPPCSAVFCRVLPRSANLHQTHWHRLKMRWKSTCDRTMPTFARMNDSCRSICVLFSQELGLLDAHRSQLWIISLGRYRNFSSLSL